ncbi:protein-L-isoaspartate(D-aspartate) O-methyltransferase [Paraflavisolibacter sp. H34]|uniref:protein-L-isoaspartate(D-aspartate) O-methyltransferase n=1 Tax=Huijunlia imazamoxiresistens TaxID=3127457 RepID=UPI003018CC5A
MMRSSADTPHHERLRRKLVNEIARKGITDERVLEAIYSIPRHLFMDVSLEDKAYEDHAFPIAEGQTISQPYTVAYQTQLLEVKPGERVLEIGTGSAYQAAVLAAIGAEVYTIERQKKLFDTNREFDYLKSFSNIHFFYGDGYEGLPQFAPFDKILLTAAAPEVPPLLVEQLRRGGLMVLPLGSGPVQQMMRVRKIENSHTQEEFFDNFSFVPMLEGKRE